MKIRQKAFALVHYSLLALGYASFILTAVFLAYIYWHREPVLEERRKASEIQFTKICSSENALQTATKALSDFSGGNAIPSKLPGLGGVHSFFIDYESTLYTVQLQYSLKQSDASILDSTAYFVILCEPLLVSSTPLSKPPLKKDWTVVFAAFSDQSVLTFNDKSWEEILRARRRP